MNCWEILGIKPTGDRDRIQQAYEQQLKFASGDDADKLNQAFREATGVAPERAEAGQDRQPHSEQDSVEPSVGGDQGTDRALDATEGQVVREVAIQIKALLNDSGRSQDVGIWKAILCEPPADQLPLRREIGRQLEPQIRPMAENGSLPAPVAHFLGGWFEWFSLQEQSKPVEDTAFNESEAIENDTEQPPQLVNFWPAVIGWIVGLAILATLFGGMGGGG